MKMSEITIGSARIICRGEITFPREERGARKFTYKLTLKQSNSLTMRTLCHHNIQYMCKKYAFLQM
jgi:hypothetical protein